MPVSSKQLKTSTNASTNSFKKKQSIQEVHPFKPRMSHTSLFKCIHINVISMKNLPEALSRSCTSSTWQINESTHLFGAPCVVIPPWTRLKIQISDPLDVLRWSHHLPLGIANQLHHILSCGGENPCRPSKFQLSKAQTPQSPVLSLALWPVNSLRLHPKRHQWTGERGFIDCKSFNHPCWFWDPDSFSANQPKTPSELIDIFGLFKNSYQRLKHRKASRFLARRCPLTTFSWLKKKPLVFPTNL